MRFPATLALSFLLLAAPALAGGVHGRVTDRTGGALAGATIRILNIATGEQATAVADAEGQYRVPELKVGTYRIAASLTGFSDASRNVIVETASTDATADFTLEIGGLRRDVTVTADRGARDTQGVPVRVDTLSAEDVRMLTPTSTGDALLAAPGVTPVGNGPFQVRPRLRGLDSTRVLVLVDGERLNNARTATDRAGVEVGLVDPTSIDSIEVLGGAGSVLYGTDALAGTINILTNRPQFASKPQFTAGFDGYYSTNENGQRGGVTLGFADKRWAVRFVGGGENFDNYSAGKDYAESSQQFHTSGQLKQADTIDTNFGFTFKKFPEAFNAPFTRASAEVPVSAATGSSANLAGIVKLTSSQSLEFKYLHRSAEDVGFPDFQQRDFFQSITLPWSKLDKISASYSINNLTPWLQRLTIHPYYQRQDRQLHNQLPVQFPVPTAQSFFPISVFRLNIQSDTRQQVWTPGVDVQATLLTRPTNLLTAGITAFRDRSEDERLTVTETTMIGAVTLGQFGPAATVFPSPIVLGTTTEPPVRVPNASFRDVAAFVHDEWTATPILRITGGLRIDGYNVTTEATPGYDVAKLVAGAVPPIDPATLPDINGDTISRNAFTGEAGVVAWSSRPVSLFAHYVHSYRHPNLEELLFSGPATAGNIVPNVTVQPETGNNVDIGSRFQSRYGSGSVAYFNNTYDNFISTEVVASSPAGSISQAINLARVRIQGVEAQAETPFSAARLLFAPYAAMAYNYGTVLEGTTPLTGISLDGEPQDNITPWKISLGLRVGDRGARWWASYGLRTETDVTRVSPLLSESPFLIAQDLLGLDGFTVQRVAAGYNWRKGAQALGFTVSVDNLADTFYREQYQFAPARGRTVTFSVRVLGVK